jgi:hypothetical protein
MTTGIKKVLDDLAGLSLEERTELARVFVVDGNLAVALEVMERILELVSSSHARGAANENSTRRFDTGDLMALLRKVEPDHELADDIEAGIRERREADEGRTSPWDR